MTSCPMLSCDTPDTLGAVGITPACSGHLAQSPAPSTSVDSTHQQQHKQPAKVKASASKAKQAKAPATGSKAKSPRSSSGASASSTPAKKRCTAARHAPAVKQELLDCEDDEGDDCDLSGSAAAPGAAAERKGPISHSTVEKQRRDRINSLIDLLAEQVPPVSSKYSGSQAAAVRRPKHVVLSDTLALLSKIRSALKEQEQTISRLVSTTSAPAAPAFEPEREAAGSGQTTPCGSCAAGGPGVEECLEASAPAAHAAQPSPISSPMQQAGLPLEQASCAPVHVLFPAQQVSCNPAAAPVPPPAGAADAPSALDCPDVSVFEQAPGCFAVSLRCPHKPDLYAELCEGLSNLPVTITELRLLPNAGPLPPTAPHVSASDPEDVLMRASLQLTVRPGATVTADQLQLALYMSACWGCPQLPPLDDAMVGTCTAPPAPWGAEAAEYLLPQACGWGSCDSLLGCGPTVQPLHPSSSSASMASWYDVL